MTEEERNSVLDKDREEVKRKVEKKNIFKNKLTDFSNDSFKSLNNLLRGKKNNMRGTISNSTTTNEFILYWYGIIDNFIA